MAPAGGLGSSSSEGCLPRRHAGLAAFGSLPELKPCSSAASKGIQHFDSKGLSSPSVASRRRSHFGANNLSTLEVLSSMQDQCKSGYNSNAAPRSFAAGRGSEMSSLPPLVESGRGMVRTPTSPPIGRRPSKRSRSSTCGHLPSISEVDSVTKSRSWPQSVMPPLSASQSTGALQEVAATKCGNIFVDSDVESCLVTALGGNNARASPINNCHANEIEAHLQELMGGLLEGKENSPAPKKKMERRAARAAAARARISDHKGDNENAIVRKGTGFVHLSPSPLSSECHARIVDDHGDNENSLFRKGTGFVHLNSSPAEGTARRASIVDDHGDNENKIKRKGTGFIHLGGSPERMHKQRAKILDPHGDNESNIRRSGTGFVHLSALPKDEDEPPSVGFTDITGGENNIQRKGTGFVFLNRPPACVRIADSHGDNENGIVRKGTGFVDLSKCGCDLLSPSSGSCSVGSIDSPHACRNVSDPNASAEMVKEHMSLVETL